MSAMRWRWRAFLTGSTRSEAGGKPVRGTDPVALLKAVKNDTEIAGTRSAHERDAVALARFLDWVDQIGSRRQAGARHRSGGAAEGGEERHRNRRHAQRA